MFKTKLQEICHKHSWNFPKYTTVKDGPDHSPRFTSTVVVNGVSFESPKYILIRSSKEAQNQAAKLAFDHFTDPKTILPHIPNSHSAQNNPVPMSSVMLNLYKNRLRLYAEKKNITLPEYSCESDGPPHACRFKSRVTIGGRTYETLQFFATLKDAEHAVAKVAFESLPCDDIPEDERLYKNILQELTQKEGFLFPTYDTIKSGPSHMPTFVSTVEIGDQTFRGWEAKSKKQAEMHAAKVAYTSLTERRASQNKASEISSNVQAIVANKLQPNITKSNLISCQEQAENDKGRASLNNASEISSNVQAIVADKLQPNITKSHLISCEEQAENDKGMANQNPIVLSPGGHVEEKVEVSSSCLQSIATDDLQQNIRTKAKLVSRKEEDTEDKDINPKRFKCSSSSEAGYALLQDPFSTPSEDSANSLTGDVTLPRSENC